MCFSFHWNFRQIIIKQLINDERIQKRIRNEEQNEKIRDLLAQILREINFTIYIS